MGNQRGSAALLGLIMMVLLGSMGAMLLTLSTAELHTATSHRDGIAAQYLAEAGIQYAITKLKTDPGFVSETETKKHITTSQSLGTMPTVGSYTVVAGPDPKYANTKKRLITATGVVNQATRQVNVQITLPNSGEVSPFIIIWNN